MESMIGSYLLKMIEGIIPNNLLFPLIFLYFLKF